MGSRCATGDLATTTARFLDSLRSLEMTAFFALPEKLGGPSAANKMAARQGGQVQPRNPGLIPWNAARAAAQSYADAAMRVGTARRTRTGTGSRTAGRTFGIRSTELKSLSAFWTTPNAA